MKTKGKFKEDDNKSLCVFHKNNKIGLSLDISDHNKATHIRIIP